MTPFASVGAGLRWAGSEADFRPLGARLRVAYQPIVTWPNRQVLGFEALMRSAQSPRRFPLELFRGAQREGCLDQLGCSVRELIANDLAHVPEGVSIFVNVTRDELDADVLGTAIDPLLACANRVVLEVTEDGTTEIPGDELSDRMTHLRSFGYRFALDDLGAGKNGMALFAECEFDVVKIDQRLIRGVAEQRTKRRLIQLIHELCEERGSLCISEGVESPQELDALLPLGAATFQGYLFGKPRVFSEEIQA